MEFLHKHFNEFDSDGNGSLDEDEFYGMILTLLEKTSLGRSLNVMNSGTVRVAVESLFAAQTIERHENSSRPSMNREEFFSLVEKFQNLFFEVEFDRMDVNKDGSLDGKELRRFLYASRSAFECGDDYAEYVDATSANDDLVLDRIQFVSLCRGLESDEFQNKLDALEEGRTEMNRLRTSAVSLEVLEAVFPLDGNWSTDDDSKRMVRIDAAKRLLRPRFHHTHFVGDTRSVFRDVRSRWF